MIEKKTGRRKILREFTITEISAVNRPAQEHARMVLMKRREPDGHEEDEAPFQTRVSEVAKRDGCSRLQAMQTARAEYPQAIEAYQAQRPVVSRPSFTKAAVPGAVREFRAKVAEIASTEGISQAAAMSRVRREHPDLFDRYQLAS